MISRIPFPATVTGTGGTSRIDRLSLSGPTWVSAVLEALRDVPTLPSVSWDGTSDATVAIHAPESVELQPSELPDSSYELVVERDRTAITCAGPSGLVAALITLGALASDDGYRCARVTDAPRFAYRGLHLDVCRHFFNAAFVKRTIATIASLGFNVFHWHLTEDQGWRLPVPSRPRLMEVSAYRTQPDGSVHGGAYTKDEIVDVVAYAGRLGVLVIPEIELPGHAQAAIAAYPELGCTGQQMPVRTAWGISDEVFCAGKEEIFDFLSDVFDEVVTLFPSRYVHLGGDECPKTRWQECPSCQARIEQEGLKDEHELQSYVVGRATAMLADRGKVAIGWDEILEGGLPEGTTVMSWRGTAGGKEAARLGHDVIMTPTSHCYFDYRQFDTEDAPGFGAGRPREKRPYLPITTVHAFDPLADLTPEQADRVIGGQANVWTEYLPRERDVEEMVLPRLLAMAEVLWSAPDTRDFTEFAARARDWQSKIGPDEWHLARLPELG